MERLSVKSLQQKYLENARKLFAQFWCLPESVRVALCNEIKLELHEVSPFRDEPVDCVLWAPAEDVVSNDYNPNSVAPPEMELLKISIESDGYTQPIVAWKNGKGYEVVDGFHRNRVGRECETVRQRVRGYLPLAVINAERSDRSDRIAATIRHNRARGKHQIDGMSEIVVELKRRNWSPEKIGRELGMEADEVLRLAQISGLEEMFGDRQFSEAWEHDGPIEEESATTSGEEGEEVNLEWMNEIELSKRRKAGWYDRTTQSSVLYAKGGKQLGVVQRSRFKRNEWFYYAYVAPIVEGRAKTRKEAKKAVVRICKELR